MGIDVDQSGRVENTKSSSVFALGGDVNRCTVLSAKSKRVLIRQLRKPGQTRDFYLDIFGCCLFLLIRDLLSTPITLTVDQEYVGKGRAIKRIIEKLAERAGIDIKSEIRFSRIGKLSPAHQLAIKNFREKSATAGEISPESILRLINKLK